MIVWYSDIKQNQKHISLQAADDVYINHLGYCALSYVCRMIVWKVLAIILKKAKSSESCHYLEDNPNVLRSPSNLMLESFNSVFADKTK